MITSEEAVECLYEIARQQPYEETKSYVCSKIFVPSYPTKSKPFVLDPELANNSD